ncbi:hypothetical protein AB0F52_35290 [Amycolatopsis sp. NPDC024027]|uniref:hypothetical protein n=1 Tax=Amycolatopsis sp. NPDC024027 TaxID=3154327 RepID=UPI0033EC275F
MTTAEQSAISDAAEFLSGGLRPHECRSCGTCVLVKKNSIQHTSIQWTSRPADTCPVFADAGGPSALLDTCPKLADSISGAVREGTLAVADG